MWMKLSLSVITLVSAFALSASSVAALGASGDTDGKSRAKKAKHEDKKNGHANGRGGKDNRGIAKNRDIVVIDRDGHLRVVREFYAGQSLPPGLAKRDSLPPGLSKQLHERGRLPPGLQKRLRPVPPDLARRLPPIPPYHHRYFAGPDLIVVDSRTDRIVALIRAVFP
jgi:hypothetical protein